MVDDQADPASQDPIARMSTRVACSLPCQAQTSLDPKTMREWIPGITYGAHAFFARNKDPQYGKLKTKEERFQYFLDRRKEILPLIRDFSAYEQASADDPPMLLSYGGQKDVMPPSGDSNATHHPKFGEHLHKRLQELGVPSWYWANNVPEASGRYNGWMGHFKFLDDHLKREK
jgi:hypothetical protein